MSEESHNDLIHVLCFLEKCPFYLIADRVERKISSPGYPDPFPSHSSCEYYIRSRDQSSVVYIRFTEKLLSPGDKTTFYDGSDGSIIARYNETLNEELSVTTKSASVRVVFTFGKTKPGQRFWFYYKMIPSGNLKPLNFREIDLTDYLYFT